jgi:hypothetical protein
MRWYELVRFKCPTCGQRLAVEAGQVRRFEQVACDRCNAELLLAAEGAEAPGVVDPNTGERPTLVRLRLR